MDGQDYFDLLPDPILLLIFNKTKDTKSLINCRLVSTRFNTLIPQTDTLFLRVDRVVSEDSDDNDSFLAVFLRSVFRSIYEMVMPKASGEVCGEEKSPAGILRGFERVKELEIELPNGDLRLEKGATVRWTAEFGKGLRNCVILGFRSPGMGDTELGGNVLKMRVVWTISALIAASARHYMVKEIVKEHIYLERLVVRDREGEGTVVIERDGLREIREQTEEEAAVEAWCQSNRRSPVPAVRMRMRHEPKMELSSGEIIEGATLVVVRPAGNADSEAEEESSPPLPEESKGPAFEAFEVSDGAAVQKLLTSRSYLLEMNSF